MGRLILISGPSGVGKGPLLKAVKAFHPQNAPFEIGVIKSLESRPGGLRPGESRHEFPLADEIRGWQDDPRYIIAENRGLPQSIDLNQMFQASLQHPTILIEAYYMLVGQIKSCEFLKSAELAVTTIFLSPLSRKEISDLKESGIDYEQHIVTMMMNKIEARAQAIGKDIEDELFKQDTRLRAQDAVPEIEAGLRDYDIFLVNHDGEGHANWNLDLTNGIFHGMPVGDAGQVVEEFLQSCFCSPEIFNGKTRLFPYRGRL